MMLTRKQQFRRQVLKKTSQTRYDHNYIYAEGTSRYNDSAIPIRASSLPSVGTPNSLTQNGRTWQTTGDLHTNASSSASNQNKVKDKITFNNAVRVVLIPTRDEYRAAGLSDVMWWEDSDYSNFKESAMNELKNLVQARGKMDTKTALNILYQPHSNSQYIDEIFDDSSTKELELSNEIESPQSMISIVAVNGIDSCKKPSVIMLRKNDNSINKSIENDKKCFKSQEEDGKINLEDDDQKNVDRKESR